MADQTNTAAIIPAVGKDVEIVNRAIPKPGPKDVLIRISIAGVNPIDRVRQLYGFAVSSWPKVIGSDGTGVVAAVGSDVSEFKVGDRVIAAFDGFVTADNDRESYQTYALAPTLTTAKLPDSFSFAQGSTISLVTLAASIVFFGAFKLAVPGATSSPEGTVALPTAGSTKPIVLIWGGGSSVGNVAIQLAHFLGFTVYATASPRHHARLQKLGADVVVDYSDPEKAEAELLAAAAKDGGKAQIRYALDVIIDTKKTLPIVEQILLKSKAATASDVVPTLVHVGMVNDYTWQEGLVHEFATAVDGWTTRTDVSKWLFGNLTQWLEDGTFVPPAARVVPGGLNGLQAALNQALTGVSGEKLILEIA